MKSTYPLSQPPLWLALMAGWLGAASCTEAPRPCSLVVMDAHGHPPDSGYVVLAKPNKDWRKLDLGNLEGSVSFDGKVVRTGHSGDVLGHCYNSLAWLANKLGDHGKRLRKGMIVSSGSMVACQFVPPGSTATGRIEGLGEVTLKYKLPK